MLYITFQPVKAAFKQIVQQMACMSMTCRHRNASVLTDRYAHLHDVRSSKKTGQP